jgi:hypothetical protein
MNFYYQINENDSLAFKPLDNNSFELFIKGEATSEQKLGQYISGRWRWDDDNQRHLFLTFLKQNEKAFTRAFKSYWLSKIDGPTVWECAWRRFKIKITKTKRKTIDKFYNTVYPTR